jgi:hypothetical protein
MRVTMKRLRPSPPSRSFHASRAAAAAILLRWNDRHSGQAQPDFILMSIEIMLNAAGLAFVVAGSLGAGRRSGNVHLLSSLSRRLKSLSAWHCRWPATSDTGCRRDEQDAG